MVSKNQPQAPLQVLFVLHAHGSSHQPRHPAAPLVVQTLDYAGLATALANYAVLPRSKEGAISFVRVAVNQLASVGTRHLEPQAAQGRFAARTQTPGQHLPRHARDRYPQITIAPLAFHSHHQFINLDGIAQQSGNQGARKAQAGLLCPFFKVARMVSRLTLSVRAMARWESLSRQVARIKASFSGVTRCSFGCGVQLLRHAWHLSRWLPQRLRPKRTTQSALPVHSADTSGRQTLR